MSRRDARHAAQEAAARVHFAAADLGKYPVELSGGMRQRVAIARALVAAPDFVFFDEPFTALDVALKRRMQDLVIAASAEGRIAALFVTHDLTEAARIAHRIAVMHPTGRGIQGFRSIPGQPGARTDAEVFALTQSWQGDDPLFRHVHDVDERRIA
jgi:NitT/TauT family transport system ATP-binding protein